MTDSAPAPAPAPARWTVLVRYALVAMLFASLAGCCVSILHAIMVSTSRGHVSLVILASPFAGLLYSCLGLIVVFVAQRGERSSVFVAAVLTLLTLSVIGWLLAILDVRLTGNSSRSEMARLAGTLLAPALAGTLSARLSILPVTRPGLGLAISVQVTMMWLAALVAVLMIWTDRWQRFEGPITFVLLPWGAAIMIGLLVIPTWARPKPRPLDAETMPDDFRLELTCPNCGFEQSLPTGPTACVDCRFALLIRIEEPRCACGYLLHHLEADTCPECGRIVPENERWRDR